MQAEILNFEINKGAALSNILLNSERLILKSLSFMELSKIDNGEIKNPGIFIEPEAISDPSSQQYQRS